MYGPKHDLKLLFTPFVAFLKVAHKTIYFTLTSDKFREIVGAWADSPFNWATVKLSPKFLVVKVTDIESKKTFEIHGNRLEEIILSIAVGQYRVFEPIRRHYQDLVFSEKPPIHNSPDAVDELLQVACFGRVLYK